MTPDLRPRDSAGPDCAMPASGQGDDAHPAIGDPWRWCPRCGHELQNHRCKFVCPRCHYFLSCSDFD